MGNRLIMIKQGRFLRKENRNPLITIFVLKNCGKELLVLNKMNNCGTHTDLKGKIKGDDKNL
jgi:hypothetical protein